MNPNNKSLLFSVLIANYNNGKFLDEAIDSIKAQTYKNWEIIIVDDCSTDNSAEIYKNSETDPRIKIYFNDKNHGCGYTKRRCAELAQGEICGFLDPDDVLVGDDAIDIHVKKHMDFLNASMIYSGMYRGDENLRIIKESPGKNIKPKSSILETCSWPIHPFATFKKEKYLLTEGIDAQMKRAVDYDLYYKLEEVGDLIHLDCFQYIQRNNPNSISLNDNSYKAAAWHTYACVQAMKRRGLTDESLMLFPFEHKLREYHSKGYNTAKKTKIYKMGKVIAYPLLILRKLWKK
jgi:glycosyltransferase involved in cell wall biosynthesis